MPRSHTLDDALSRFSLIRRIYPLIHRSIPPKPPSIVSLSRRLRQGAPLDSSNDDELNHDNEITTLRFEIITIPTKLDQIDVYELTKCETIGRLIAALDRLLRLFEDAALIPVEEEEALLDNQVNQTSELACLFPKLNHIHDLQVADTSDVYGITNPNAQSEHKTQLIKVIGDMEAGASTNIAPYSAPPRQCFRFPTPRNSLQDCSRIIENFTNSVQAIFPSSMEQTVKSVLLDFKDNEIASITHAREFCKNSEMLFASLALTPCPHEDHMARLHLSGFLRREMEMLLEKDPDTWVAVNFIASTNAPNSDRGSLLHRLCAHTIFNSDDSSTIRAYFDDSAIWIGNPDAHHSMSSLALELPRNLEQFLDTLAGRRRASATIGALLACSLYHLFGSSWIQTEFDRSNILIFTGQTSRIDSDYWRPHIECRLGCESNHISDSESEHLAELVASLGVLILELEANRPAGWTDGDVDWDTNERSNIQRLSRMLKDIEWLDDLGEPYREIGLACMNFQRWTEDVHHPHMHERRLKELAILYKCIVNPLYRHLVTKFPPTRQLFDGIPGLSVPNVRRGGTRPVVLKRRVAFFDDDTTDDADRISGFADQWIQRLSNFFLCDIIALRQTADPRCLGLADIQCGRIRENPEKIRVAILDTGLDGSDMFFRGAASRIRGKRSWVGREEDYHDTSGHGTHVARLFLTLAPSAELYVAKIAEGMHVDERDFGRIADAIDWAVNEWKVDIISMSWGFHDESSGADRLDTAIDRVKVDKLMFAAASNKGGNQKRSKPALKANVICVHACDGMGNKGDMNPNPIKKGDNFAFLGVKVRSEWKKKPVYKSGTSFATPIAAAIAANILEFANFHCDLSANQRAKLFRCDGMTEIFRRMSTERDGYDYVQPELFWGGKDPEEIAKEIQEIVRAL
ncbi:hypothetical protein QBC37DRAFT_300762 [Rhypophila decipiens]|uniref:Peptidase S8/S53 domain-containing protein n=1 Tax=Rhypophila decipiens TaxID=261697 RepID=A0AAN6XTK4_9PEZI|nr:hypothetical protein QBC37DRAFT_300762 [Rhypophila decipiens]